MKKTILFAVLLAPLALASCQRSELPPDGMVTIKFNLASGTKAMPDAILSTLPQDVQLTLTKTDTQSTYKVTTGQEITLPIGTYRVEYLHNPPKTQPIFNAPPIYLSKEAQFQIDQLVTLEEGVTDYPLQVQFLSWAMVVDSNNTTFWNIKIQGNEVPVDYMVDDNLWWVFMTGDLTSLSVKMITSSDTFVVTTDQNLSISGNAIRVTPAHWYVLELGPAPRRGFLLEWPEWTQG